MPNITFSNRVSSNKTKQLRVEIKLEMHISSYTQLMNKMTNENRFFISLLII